MKKKKNEIKDKTKQKNQSIYRIFILISKKYISNFNTKELIIQIFEILLQSIKNYPDSIFVVNI